jgi:adenosylmethionine-8-amino-7-oxononanoate aminotransferase
MPPVADDLAREWAFVPGRGAPLRIARAEGSYLYTPEGRPILDAAGGAIVANIGHGRSEVARAVAEAIEREGYVVPPFVTESRLRLLERLRTRWLPGGLTRVAFTSGGSESVELAIRLARHHHVAAGRPGRFKIIGRDLSYHGTTLATLAVGGHEKRRSGLEPLLLRFPRIPACYCLRCPLERTYPECRVACASSLEEAIEREGAESVAAFIAEPIVGSTAGALVPPEEYWPSIVEICRARGILLIADEVMTGFGRTGRRFAVEHWNVAADILVGGKGLSGGYAPIGAVFATEETMAPLAERGEAPMFYTYSAHPAACAAADKVLEIVEREDLVARAARTGRELLERLEKLRSHPRVADVRGLGLLLGVEIVRDRATLEPFPQSARVTERIVGAGLRRGVFFYPGGSGPARDVITLGPPFNIEPEHVETIARVLEESIHEAVKRVEASS